MQYALIVKRNDETMFLTFKAKNIHEANETAVREIVKWSGDNINYSLFELGTWSWTRSTCFHSADIISNKSIALKEYENIKMGSKNPIK